MGYKKLLILFALIALAILSLYFFPEKNSASNLPVITVTQGDITEKVTAIGTISPQQSTSVKSPISGRVAKLLHDEGDWVNKGEPLLEIEPNPTPKDYVEAQQTLEIDRAKEQQFAADVKRYELLLAAKAISPKDQDYNQVLSEYRQAYQKRLQDQQELALLEKGKAVIGTRVIANVITSPSDGYILQRNVNLGDPVIPQTDYQAGNLLFAIADMKNLIFKGQVSETDVVKLQPNISATVKIAALPDITLQGVVTKIALQSGAAATPDATTSTAQNTNTSSSSGDSSSPFAVGYKIEIHKLSPITNLHLRSGYSATADIIVKQAKNVLLIPARVLQFSDDKSYVLVLDKHNAQQKRFIKTGLSDGVQVQVLSGLIKGEKVIDNPENSDGDNG